MRVRSVMINPSYKRRVELPYCCVPAVLKMVFEQRRLPVPDQEGIGYELGLIVPEEVVHRFNRVRNGHEPASECDTQTGREEFSIRTCFDHHELPLHIDRYKIQQIGELQEFLINHLKQGDDVVACFNSQQLLGRGDVEHVALVQTVKQESVELVDPAVGNPDLCRVTLTKPAEALSIKTTGQLGFWVISNKEET